MSSTFTNLATAFIGTFLIGGGIYGLVSPAAMGQNFGIKKVTRENDVFYPALAGNKLAVGLAIWGLKYAGEVKALGILLTCWPLAGVADTYTLLRHYGEVKGVPLHLVLTVLVVYVGQALLRE